MTRSRSQSQEHKHGLMPESKPLATCPHHHLLIDKVHGMLSVMEDAEDAIWGRSLVPKAVWAGLYVTRVCNPL